jgi:hypothetical protein
LLCGVALTAGCGGDDATGPSRTVVYSELLGGWHLEIRDTAACAGLAGPVVVTLTISQQSSDASTSFLHLEGATSHWSASGYGAGYLTGSLPLRLPGPVIVNLVLGAPPAPEATASATSVAQFTGTLTADLELSGVLHDPPDPAAYTPIFSAQACGFQLRGGHS